MAYNRNLVAKHMHKFNKDCAHVCRKKLVPNKRRVIREALEGK